MPARSWVLAHYAELKQLEARRPKFELAPQEQLGVSLAGSGAWRPLHRSSLTSSENDTSRLRIYGEPESPLESDDQTRTPMEMVRVDSQWEADWKAYISGIQAATPALLAGLVSRDAQASAEAAKLLGRFGPMNAEVVRRLIARLYAHESVAHKICRWVWPKLPAAIRQWLPRPAVDGFGACATPDPALVVFEANGRSYFYQSEWANLVAPWQVRANASRDALVEMFRRSQHKAAEKTSRATLPDLIAVLKDPDRWVSERAASVLSELGPLAQPAAPTLAMLMEDSRLPVQRRELYARVLASVDPSGRDSVGAFNAWLEDTNPFLRDAAIHRLERIGPQARVAVPGLVRIAGADPVWALRACAGSALLKIDPASGRNDGQTLPRLDEVAAFHKLYSSEFLPTEGLVLRSRIVR